MGLASLFAVLLQIGTQTLDVEVANTIAARHKGLMGRKELAEGTGMLFVYEKPQMLIFWMKNTWIPLSIGFFDEKRRLINTAELAIPLSGISALQTYSSASPAQYALEVPTHWFKEHQIRPGMQFELRDIK